MLKRVMVCGGIIQTWFGLINECIFLYKYQISRVDSLSNSNLTSCNTNLYSFN
jgi:hypothetical protein